MSELSSLIEYLDHARQTASIMRQVVEDGNTTVIGGIHIKNVEVSIFFWIVSTILSAGFIFNWVWTWWLYRGDRSFETYVDSGTDISEPDPEGFRTMTIRHWGEPRRLDAVFIDITVRKALVAAALRCNWTHRFVKCLDPDMQREILVTARNSFLRHFRDGEVACSFGHQVEQQTYILSLTGSDTKERGGVRMFRLVFVTESDLFAIHKHPSDQWHFEGDAERMRVRLQTLRKMADAYFTGDGRREGPGGKLVQIVIPAYCRLPK